MTVCICHWCEEPGTVLMELCLPYDVRRAWFCEKDARQFDDCWTRIGDDVTARNFITEEELARMQRMGWQIRRRETVPAEDREVVLLYHPTQTLYGRPGVETFRSLRLDPGDRHDRQETLF